MTHIFGHAVVAICGGYLPAAQTVGMLSIFLWGYVTNAVCTETRQDSPFGLIH